MAGEDDIVIGDEAYNTSAARRNMVDILAGTPLGAPVKAWDVLMDWTHDSHQDRGERKVSSSGEEYLEKPGENKYQLYGKWNEDEARTFAREQGWDESKLTFHGGERDSYFTYGGDMSDGDFSEYTDAFEGFAEVSGRIAQENMRAAAELAEQQIQRNIARAPQVSGLASRLATQSAGNLNQFMEQQFLGILDRLMPSWRADVIGAGVESQRDIMGLVDRFATDVLPKAVSDISVMSDQAIRNTTSLLRGELPPDVMAQIVQGTGEAGQRFGVFGQAGVFRGARDIGRTSLDLMQQGLANAPAALGLAPQAYGQLGQILGMPMQSAANLTNLASAYRAPLVDVGGIYNNQLGLLSGATNVAPTAMMNTAAQVGLNTLGAVSDFASGMYSFQQNYGLQQQALQLQQQQFQAQQRSQMMSGLGSLVGMGIGAFGGPVGMAVGASLGGGFGGMLG